MVLKSPKMLQIFPLHLWAKYGSGSPVIGILGEFDAECGDFSKASTYKRGTCRRRSWSRLWSQSLWQRQAWGQPSPSKNKSKKEISKEPLSFMVPQPKKTIFAKVWMARAGVFDQLDVCMDWHPGASIEAGTQSSKALVDFRVKFYGSSSHASSDPWNGTSAVDAMELYTTGLNYYREHILPTSRIHYQIEKSGRCS